MSYKCEVQTAGDGDHWAGNGLRFATAQEADSYGVDLAMRWTAVKDIRTVECIDAVTSRITAGKLEHIT